MVLALWLPATSLAADGKESRGGQGHNRQTADSRGGQARPDGTTRRPTRLLSRGAGYGQNGGSGPVRVLQRRLRELGHAPGPIDGLYGPLTQAAVRSFQRAKGLAVDGIAGPRTQKAVRASMHLVSRGAGYGIRGGSKPVRVIQRRLRAAGHSPGTIDGVYGPRTEAAVASFQRASGLVVDGVTGAQTQRALRSPRRAERPLVPLDQIQRRPAPGFEADKDKRGGAQVPTAPASPGRVIRVPESGATPGTTTWLALGIAALVTLVAATAGASVARRRRRRGGLAWFPPRRGRKPLLFVDVDGVVALNRLGDEAPPGRKYLLSLGYVYVPKTSREHVRRLEERFELVWATGWEERANRELPELLGLSGPLPVVSFGRRAYGGSSQWKIRQVARYAGQRPAAWIDDHIDDRHWRWARRRRAPTLLVRADPAVGISEQDVDRLLDWARALAGESPARPRITAPAVFRRAPRARAPDMRGDDRRRPGRPARRGPSGPGHR